jgi:hypothetical protein
MGYKMFKILVKDAKSVILLSPSVFQLPIVTVKPQKSKTIEINHFGKKNLGAGYMNTNFDSTTQIAQLIENTDNNLWYLKEIKIARWPKTHLKKNQKTQFRIRFYSIDEFGKPNKDIYEPIVVKNEADNLVKVDVENKKMLLPQKGIFIAVEWLKIAENFIDETYKIHKTVNGVDKGEVDKNDKFYTPMFVFKLPYGKTKNCQVFTLNYKGEWKERCHEYPFGEKGYMNNLALSITVTD